MGDQQPLLFGPSSDQPDASSLLVDLDDLFAGKCEEECVLCFCEEDPVAHNCLSIFSLDFNLFANDTQKTFTRRIWISPMCSRTFPI